MATAEVSIGLGLVPVVQQIFYHSHYFIVLAITVIGAVAALLIRNVHRSGSRHPPHHARPGR